LQDEVTITLGSPDAPGGRALADGIVAPLGGTVVGGLEGLGIYQVRFPSSFIYEQIGALWKTPGVIDVARSSFGGVGTHATPSDWSDDSRQATWPYLTIGAPEAWDRSTGSTTKVGIVDAGTAFSTHEDLHVMSRPAPVAGAAQHATQVAGFACARANGIGLVGAAWGCPIVSTGYTSQPSGDTWQAVLQAAYANLAAGPSVINMSLGWNNPNGGCASQSQADAAAADLRTHYRAMFNQLFDSPAGRNVVWTLSAGNACVAGALSPMAIAALDFNLPNVVIVQATNSDGSLSSFSNFRTGGIQIGAPGGVDVPPDGDGWAGMWGTVIGKCGLFGSDCSGYAKELGSPPHQEYGTSFAAPIVAGVAAMVRSYYPTKTAREVVSCIVEGARVHGRQVASRSTSPAGWASGEDRQLPVYQVWAPGALDCPDRPAEAAVPNPFGATWCSSPGDVPDVPNTFLNPTAGNVSLYWVDSGCQMHRFATLGPNDRITYASPTGHVVGIHDDGSYCGIGLPNGGGSNGYWQYSLSTTILLYPSWDSRVGLSP